MLMFTGCYLLIIQVICDVLFDWYRVDQCMLLIWLSPLGLPLPLILATLLMKIVRVYYIFNTFKVLKQSTKCKDYALVIYTVPILLPQITLLTLRTAISPSRRMSKITECPGFFEIEQVCNSENPLIWYELSCAYLLIVFGAITFIAIKTRKFRYEKFKDTKQVNLLICLFFCRWCI